MSDAYRGNFTREPLGSIHILRSGRIISFHEVEFGPHEHRFEITIADTDDRLFRFNLRAAQVETLAEAVNTFQARQKERAE